MKYLHFGAFTLLLLGGLNWLMFSIWQWDIGQLFGGMDSMTSRVIYVLFGLSAVYEMFTHRKRCRTCAPEQH